jgi:hypothetical protein
MYPWQLSCFRQMLKFVNKLRHMPDTTLARMALCDAIADHRDYQHNNWFAQPMSRFKHQYCGTWTGCTVLYHLSMKHNVSHV